MNFKFNKKYIFLICAVIFILISLMYYFYYIDHKKYESKNENFLHNDIYNEFNNDNNDENDIVNQDDKKEENTENNNSDNSLGTEDNQLDSDNNSDDNTSVTEDNQSTDNNTVDTNENQSNSSNGTSKPEEPEILTLVEENINLANEILDSYRVSILYDDKANFYYNGVAATKTSELDAEELNSSLKAIERGLKKMPQSVLDTLRLSNGYNILLFKELPQGQDGLAVITSHVYQILLDVDNWQQERIFYHETFHLMERYMYLENGSVDPFTNWNSYNPSDFVYGIKNQNYLYIAKETPLKDITFTSSYAQTNAGEDRAELFEDLMHRTKKYYYMESGYGINEKAKYLSDIIEIYFGNISNAPWDNYISW